MYGYIYLSVTNYTIVIRQLKRCMCKALIFMNTTAWHIATAWCNFFTREINE